MRKRPRRNPPQKPKSNRYATVAFYGPDDKTATKLVVSIFRGKKLLVLRRWLSDDILNNSRVKQEMVELMKAHNIHSAIATDHPIGCIHEEGIDYPEGQDCPFCPFWRGKQGSTASEEYRSWRTQTLHFDFRSDSKPDQPEE